ncbi:MAG: ribbon-helix-helix protein, CopG family [Myxococcaceae bacterium]|nr:ribbon-helix-helix protein, CopG family [Myxococcaceae bacterium]
MKTIQITIDDQLLRSADKDPEVKRDGRSAVIRRALAAYLARKRRTQLAEAYRRAYSSKPPDELSGWSEEGAWPEE